MANQPATHPERTSNGVDANGKFCTTPGSPFGGPQCTTTYTEGIFAGYRWYDQQHQTPLYPFGYGLSYTHFAYSGLHWAPARDGGLDVAFRITNTGAAPVTKSRRSTWAHRPVPRRARHSRTGRWRPTAGSRCGPASPSWSGCTCRPASCSTGTRSPEAG